jgi:hypothetical protein
MQLESVDLTTSGRLILNEGEFEKALIDQAGVGCLATYLPCVSTVALPVQVDLEIPDGGPAFNPDKHKVLHGPPVLIQLLLSAQERKHMHVVGVVHCSSAHTHCCLEACAACFGCSEHAGRYAMNVRRKGGVMRANHF